MGVDGTTAHTPVISIVMGFDPPKPVIPAKAGIHDLTISQHFVEEKSWIPAFAGMTVELPRVRPQVSWY
jgi:hypothetical protein